MGVIKVYNSATLRAIAETKVICCKQSKNGTQKITIPDAVLEQILRDDNLPIPAVKGLILNPFIDPEGIRVEEPGCHNGFLAVFETTSFLRKSLAEALTYISDIVLSEFTFAGEETTGPDLTNPNRLAACAAMMTASQRKILDLAPLIIIRGPEFGAGKSVLTDVITTIAAGHPVAKTYLPTSSTRNDNPELAKRIETALLNNPPAIAIDNLQDGGTVQSTVLTAALTQSKYDFRRLGVHDGCTVQTNVLFIGNGRNITVSDQLASRSLIIELGEGRAEYHRNPVADAVKNRAEIISATNDIIEAGLAANIKIKGTRFKMWDKYIIAPLALASGVDISEHFSKVEEESDERDSNRIILQSLYKLGKALKAEDLAIAFNVVEDGTVSGKDDGSWKKLFHEGLGGLLDSREDKRMTLTGRKVATLLKPLLNRKLEIEDKPGNKVRVMLERTSRKLFQVARATKPTR